MDQSLNMVKIAYDALDDKLAEDIKIIDIRSISVLADYFIIADGNNKNQVQAMVDNVQEELFKAGYEMKQMEGYREGNWILLDFGDIIIHIFDNGTYDRDIDDLAASQIKIIIGDLDRTRLGRISMNVSFSLQSL